jgi:hypothetical protein
LNIKRLAGFFIVLRLFCAGFALYAQSTAQEMEALLAKNELTYAEATHFILRAADRLAAMDEEEAFWFAAKQGWLPKSVSPGDSARLDGLALLIMNSFDMQGGVMYSITKSPHYAFRELQYRDIIQGRADRYMKVPGDLLLFIVGRVLTESEEAEERAAVYALERQAAEGKRRLQPDSFDFGLIIGQDTAFYHDLTYGTTDFIYRGDVVPRVSFLLGDNGYYITSLGIAVEFDGEFKSVLEVLRTELGFNFGAFGLKAGRFTYADPMGFVANSLYDGIQFTFDTALGQFALGGWYTGVLYKKNARILMTGYDRDIYSAPLVKKDFFNTYFAPQRMFYSLDWEHPSIGEFLQLKTTVTAQFDMTGQAESLHSQYFTFSAGMNFSRFLVTAGGSLEAFEAKGAENPVSFAAAGELALYLPLHLKYDGQLILKARYGSGNTGGLFYAFTPITTSYYGEIFQAALAGHTILDITYSARFLETLGASFTVSYFIRNDPLIPANYIITGTEAGNSLLGAELFTKVVWSPFSDMQYTLGIGAFIPPYGNNWPGSGAIWKIHLTTVLALY